MRGTETIKEMNEGNVRFDCRQMGNCRQVHHFLYAAGREHSNSGGTAVHHILMIAKNRVGMSAHAAGGHMQHARMTVARDDVEAGNHQHQALRRSESRCQGPGFQRTVNSAHSACL